jgi:hypothetical protein
LGFDGGFGSYCYAQAELSWLLFCVVVSKKFPKSTCLTMAACSAMEANLKSHVFSTAESHIT